MDELYYKKADLQKENVQMTLFFGRAALTEW